MVQKTIFYCFRLCYNKRKIRYARIWAFFIHALNRLPRRRACFRRPIKSFTQEGSL